MTPVKVAACQVPDIREDRDAALRWMEVHAQQASAEGARLVCFPECFLQGYLTEERQARRQAIDLGSSDFDALLERLGSVVPTLVFGLIEIEAGTLFNTAVVVDHGRLVGRYRKSHLLPGERFFRPGTSWPVFEVDGLTFGINICADTGIPEPAAAVARLGARLIVCPANNMMKREGAEKWKHHHNRIRAQRAIENRVWLLSSDVTGERGNRVSLGPTAVIDPTGHVMTQVPLSEIGMIVTEIV
jgi:predicted amidohydrolase